MDSAFYLKKFEKAANRIDKKILIKKQIEISVGLYQDSVFLKLYKKNWSNNIQNPIESESRIFFSLWINDLTLKEQKLFYNIHALKLRHLKGYSIESRKFADVFRTHFKKFEHKWENVSVKFGPLTLMQGWIYITLESFEEKTIELTTNFLEITNLVDTTLAKFK
ncbi:MAG: hypothetical protein SFY56_08395 [Bacteroidota bacterium]|nr:hypothetical protein [Bacteroidota bacterium]